MKFGQKIDKSAADQLAGMIKSFPKSWGSVTEEGWMYKFGGIGKNCVTTVQYDARKQLMGGVYSLEFTLVRDGLHQMSDETAVLKYEGRFIKGSAYFTSGKKSSSTNLADFLNNRKDLIDHLSALDLLSLSVSVSKGNLTVKLSPLGGAYTYTVFPPMKYGGLLPDKDLELIRKSLVDMAVCFSDYEMPKAAGASL